MRIRIYFSKNNLMRYTGHLDLYRTWERTFRRARLPLAYTQGYNPHPKINLAATLPLGFTSQGEIVDIHLEQELPVSEIEAALKPALPPGLEVQQIEIIESKQPAPQTLVESAEYVVQFLEPQENLSIRLQALLDSSSLPRIRRERSYDLRPLIEAAQMLPPDESGQEHFMIRMAARESATGRPDEVLAVLGVPIEQARIHRIRLCFRQAVESLNVTR